MVSLVGFAQRASGGGSVTVPAHSAGDIIVFVDGAEVSTPPSIASGFSSVAAAGGVFGSVGYSYRAQWRVSDGTITSVTCTWWGQVWVFTDADSVRGVAGVPPDSSLVTSHAVPSLGGLDTSGTGYLLTACLRPDVFSSATAPWVRAGTGTNDYARIESNTLATSPAGTIGTTNSIPSLLVTLEIRRRSATATAAITEDADQAAGAAQTVITAASTIGEDGDTIAASNLTPRTATAAITEGADAIDATAVLPVSASAALTVTDTIAAAGRIDLGGIAALIESNDTLASGGRFIVPIITPADRIINDQPNRIEDRTIADASNRLVDRTIND